MAGAGLAVNKLGCFDGVQGLLLSKSLDYLRTVWVALGNKHSDLIRPVGKAAKEAPELFTVGFCFFEGPR